MNRETKTCFQRTIPVCTGIELWFFTNIVWAIGGITTDGTVGASLDLKGTQVTIPQTLGVTVGNNLFHSFSQFNVNRGQVVTFTENISNSLDNVISRVTGDSASYINGVLRSTPGGHANFYFINPNGTIFGEHARIDVPAAFHMSTAAQLKFQGRTVYSANASTISTLTSAAPAAFGFLATSPATNGLIQINGAKLIVKPEQSLDLSAANITIKNNSILKAIAGTVRIVAVGARDRDVSISGAVPITHGILRINSSIIDSSGNGAGRLILRGGEMTITRSNLFVDNTGARDARDGQGINLRTGNSSLTIDKSRITANSFRSGKAGGVAVVSQGDMAIVHGGMIASLTHGAGQAGAVTVTSKGNLSIDNKNSDEETGILSEAYLGNGNAGMVSVTSKGDMSIVNGGVISSSTWTAGKAGSVTVTSKGHLTIDSQDYPDWETGISSQAYPGSSGNAGRVSVSAQSNMSIVNGGMISSSTWSSGKAGVVKVATQGGLTIGHQGANWATGIFSEANLGKGNAGTVSISSKGRISIVDGGMISSSTWGSGKAGTVTVIGNDKLSIEHGFTHQTGIFSETIGNGNAGMVSVTSKGDMLISDAGMISSLTYNTGKAGTVAVNAKALDIRNSGLISSASWGKNSSGRTGQIVVTARDAIRLVDGEISIANEARVVDAAAVPGSITLNTPNLSLRNSSITTNSTGSAGAGSIAINFSHWLTLNSSYISTLAKTGNGGSITIGGGEFINLQNSGIKTTASGTNSNGGDIAVNARMLLMDNGFIQANARGGFGGDITLALNTLILSGSTLAMGGNTPIHWIQNVFGFNVIQAASATGINGTLNVTAPQLNISGIIANFDSPRFDTGIIDQDYCTLSIGSSLTSKGRGGMRPKRGDLLLF
ncbi:Filamentous hemagglutinin N-terminal domain-containing protein [Gammaproteobacteria bacterium]